MSQPTCLAVKMTEMMDCIKLTFDCGATLLTSPQASQALLRALGQQCPACEIKSQTQEVK